MKKFKVRYYVIEWDRHKELEIQKIVEEEIEADSFYCNDGVFFVNNLNSNIAYFSKVISVKEIK